MVTYRSRIEQDEPPENPRHDFDQVSTFAMSHRRYDFGDKGAPTDPDQIRETIAKVEREGGESLPVYMYDHSGQTIRTYPFECPWDSGQIGMIWMTAAQIRETFAVKRITKAVREKARTSMIAEIQTLDDYLTGNVYGVIIESVDGDDVEEVDSCWGFYGHDYATEEAARMLAEHTK
jgi:hypothetical protein